MSVGGTWQNAFPRVPRQRLSNGDGDCLARCNLWAENGRALGVWKKVVSGSPLIAISFSRHPTKHSFVRISSDALSSERLFRGIRVCLVSYTSILNGKNPPIPLKTAQSNCAISYLAPLLATPEHAPIRREPGHSAHLAMREAPEPGCIKSSRMPCIYFSSPHFLTLLQPQSCASDLLWNNNLSMLEPGKPC